MRPQSCGVEGTHTHRMLMLYAGTPLSGAMQLGKTFVMRFGFGWAWNWCSSQQLDMPVFDEFIQEQ